MKAGDQLITFKTIFPNYVNTSFIYIVALEWAYAYKWLAVEKGSGQTIGYGKQVLS